ncbi:MAG: class I SAM-dependent methyltransferase [Snowella sp.]|nr:class I SAM-dependent methyltransferase [Snowella sp.]
MIQNRINREKLYSTADYWDSKAEVHQGDAVSMWPNNNLNYYYNREQLSLLNQYLPQMAGAKVLDVGCGTGRLSRYLVKRGATVVGIDFSPKTIAIAQQQSPDGNPTYRVQSIFELNEEKGFDILVCWGSLTVACRDKADLLNVMCRIRKALNPNGQIFLLEPIHKGFLHRVLNMDTREFCEVMNQAGFQVEDIYHLHFWPMRLLLCYTTWPKFITAAGYYLGEGIMNLFGHKSFGDYKAIIAKSKQGGNLI